MKLTVEDVLAAQERSIAGIDENKTCETCKNDGNDEICCECFDSFLGIYFNQPSSWRAKE